MISVHEFLMGRDKEYPLTTSQAESMAQLLAAVNYLRGMYGKPLKVSSGYRPGHFNTLAKGKMGSAHINCQAIDLLDPDGDFARWCLSNDHLLKQTGLYMENPEHTNTPQGRWTHLQTRRPASGSIVFDP